MKEINYTITPIKNTEIETGKILIQGSLTLNNMKEILPDIQLATQKYQDLEIMLRNIDNIDLSALQVFLSLKQTFSKQKKILKFDVEFSDDIKNLITQAGFIDLFNNSPAFMIK